MIHTDIPVPDYPGAAGPHPWLWRLDPDVDALFADVEKILCAALVSQPCPPPASGTRGGIRDHRRVHIPVRMLLPDRVPRADTGRAKQRSPPPRHARSLAAKTVRTTRETS